MARATVYDVAEMAGVSISTVSRVLNSPEKVNEATRARVLNAVDSLRFVPKAEAVARARKRYGRIGVLAPFFTYPSFVQRLRGIATALADLPYELAIYYVDSADRRDAYLSSLPVARSLDGLIVMALPFNDHIAARLIEHGLETILIGFGRAPFSSVEIDDQAGGRLVAEYLTGQGHRRFGFVGDANLPDYALPTSDVRLAGYRRALAEAGHALPDAYVAFRPHGLEPAREAGLPAAGPARSADGHLRRQRRAGHWRAAGSTRAWPRGTGPTGRGRFWRHRHGRLYRADYRQPIFGGVLGVWRWTWCWDAWPSRHDHTSGYGSH